MKNPGRSHGLQWNWKAYGMKMKTITAVILLSSTCSAGYPEFNAVNRMRADKGLFAYRYDSRLDAVAGLRANSMAARRRGGHASGSFNPGSHEGVSWGQGTARPESACYTDGTRLRTVGASCERSGGRYYCSVVYGGDTGYGWLGHTPTITPQRESVRSVVKLLRRLVGRRP